MRRNLVSAEVSWFLVMLSQIYEEKSLIAFWQRASSHSSDLVAGPTANVAHTSSDNLLNRARLSAFLKSSIVL